MARDQDARAGVLKRQQALESLTRELSECQSIIDVQSDEKSTTEQVLRELEVSREEISRDMTEQQRHYAELRSVLAANQMQVEQFAARRTRAENELNEALQQQQLEQENLKTARQSLSVAIEMMEQDSVRREQLLQQRDSCLAAAALSLIHI